MWLDLVYVVFLDDVVLVVSHVCCCCAYTCNGDILVLIEMMVVCYVCVAE